MIIPTRTVRETVKDLAPAHGIRDYLRQFFLMTEEASGSPDDCPDEEDFIREMPAEPDLESMEMERLFKRTSQLVRRSIHLLVLMESGTTNPGGFPQGNTHLLSFHESLFTVLYQIGQNIRRMVEVAFENDDPHEQAAYLRGKYNLHAEHVRFLRMEWVDADSSTCHDLLEQELRLAVFGDNDVMFQVRDEDGNPADMANSSVTTDNGLIISKYYFFTRILQVLMNLEFVAKLYSREKELPFSDDDVEIVELFGMDTFWAIAEDYMDRPAQV